MKAETACRHCPLRSRDAFAGNTPEELAFIEGFKSSETSRCAGATILTEGRSGADLYTLLSGWAFRYRLLRDGRRQILNFLLPGDFIGLHEEVLGSASHGVEALTDVRLCVFARERLWDLYRLHPALGYDITWLNAHEQLIVDENLLSVGRRSALERVAMLLVHLYKRAEVIGLAGPKGVPFPINQQHLADALGLSLVHTNKSLRKLHAFGLHDICNGYLQIHNPAAVQRLADYHALPVRTRPLI
jgi:CRP/FNR family transcriptional regulator, anaerobic regulatory protein